MKVLVAVDGSEYSRSCVNLLERLPLPAETEIVLFTVLEGPAPFGGAIEDFAEADADELATFRDELREERRRLLSLLAAGLAHTGWSVSTDIAGGHPADRILATADALGVDHIVIGSHGVSGVQRFLLGSVSRAVVSHADCSVLVVRKRTQTSDSEEDAPAVPTDDADPLRVLAAFDGSPSARAGVELVRSIPFRPSTEVALVTVLTVATTLYGRDILERLSASWKEYSNSARRDLENAAAVLDGSRARVTTKLIDGGSDAGLELLKLAGSWGADVIVLGSTGTSAVERLLLGSVTARVVDHAPCSVWVVRSREHPVPFRTGA